LHIEGTPLTALSALPDGLHDLHIAGIPLTALPALPDGLHNLDIAGTPLTELPALPDRLDTLSITEAPLTELPELPDGLRKLNIAGTPLTALPALPDGLHNLDIAGTPLTALPALPGGLDALGITRTPLTELPEIPGRVRCMDVINTAITRLPESIFRLSPDSVVYLSDNPLSARTRQTLLTILNTWDYSGPHIFFSMADSSTPREVRPLHQAVADWLMPTEDSGPASADSWQPFEQENDAASFSAFLDSLSETENSRKVPGFKAQVSSWLTQLAEDNELRAKTFAMATEATSSCEDRVTLALNRMKNVQLVHNAEKGVYDKNIPGLVSAGREMFRLEKLEQIAREKVNTLHFVDEIEVYLGYQNKLKEALELGSVTEAMRFFDVSGITESDLQAAEVQVKTAENSQFREWVLDWEPLHSVLKRSYPEDWEDLVKKREYYYEDAYQKQFEELKQTGLADDVDALRITGNKVMDEMNMEFRAGIRILADKILAGHLEARWS
ncbi:NEL-type E3 ubiquitin ligase domain-containing protein, partial [Salmonella enterica subsp. enterica serovar Montevideo]|nr:E3 ubiquitin--protein ligase [Salmonella enterica subsp. enterica serovar Alachua]EDA8247219.1 E3 ubiquitin--protein ligase [Salmonella enterica subsp. enterica serovar London]EDV4183064.1 E3 ubiquitin--protein ligase [Salmonella enterica subsp. enterica]EIN2811350.1 E3 ubiquitin--protein ligase [Salmonella enterica subsp. enterica serovar Bredeney]EIO0875433.1 E3 ubiquitin--protein ligase [Salmonella enterica subsp. enterica serovar Bredeney]